jgi:hypothetical protein
LREQEALHFVATRFAQQRGFGIALHAFREAVRLKRQPIDH